ncbi:purine-nucleoside phosphorylase [uncultured Campylobacter sp.]|mgnify:FL=1|uniref:purine-nucleoside phosphorylase n=1 Tax=uncultured Campylobacter sp. TaxID=218934 RepID=UPI002630E753|nr:purine-nucleoside phosphorylase [uncultured Campylobacter sp.]
MIISAGRNEVFPFALPMGVGLIDMSINLTAFLQKRAMAGFYAKYERDFADERAADLAALAPFATHSQADNELNLANPSASRKANLSQNPDKILNALPSEIIFVGSAGLYKEGEILKIYESRSAVNCEISALYELSYSPINYEIIARDSADVSYETITNSSNFITTDKKSALKFFERGYFLENMEFFAVLKVAQKFQIPAYGIFCATNFCDSNAHADFLKNHAAAKENLTKYLKTKALI